MKYLLAVVLLAITYSASAEMGPVLVTIPAQQSEATPAPKQRRTATIVGHLDHVVAYGGRFTVQNFNWGDVQILEINGSKPDTLERDLFRLVNGPRRQVAVTGLLTNHCDAALLDRNVGGCRSFDNSQKVTIRAYDIKE